MPKFCSIKHLSVVALFASIAGGASAAPITLVKLTGLTGSPIAAATAVYKSDLSVLSASFAAISITDASGMFGGAGGAFSGFDLDAIKLSTTDCSTAACAAAAPGLNLFNFSSGIVFSPGKQRAPVDPKLFGTGPSGNTVDNAVATLGLFDGVANTATPNGFVSLGDNGSIAFNLTSITSGAGLFLYLGEVGDNGEVAGSNINTLTTPVSGVPEPAAWMTMMLGFGAIGASMRARKAAVRFV